MVDPVTAMLVATAVSTAAKSAGDYFAGKKTDKAAKRKNKESERETKSDLFQDAMQRSSELEEHGRSSRRKLGKRKAQSMQDTANLVREAFNI